MQDAGPQFLWRASDTINRVDDAFHQIIDTLRAAISQFRLRQGPNPFIRVELGGVGRKMLDAETRMSSKELLERFPLMGGGVIQENDEGAAELPQQLAQKHTDLLLRDVVVEKKVVETQVVSLGAQRDPGNDGDFISAPLAITEDGS